MKEKIAVAVLSAIICFAIACLAYYGTSLFVEFLKCEVGNCEPKFQTLDPITNKLPTR